MYGLGDCAAVEILTSNPILVWSKPKTAAQRMPRLPHAQACVFGGINGTVGIPALIAFTSIVFRVSGCLLVLTAKLSS